MKLILNSLFIADCTEAMQMLPSGLFHTCVTSPPYFGLRDYGHDAQIGLEETPDQYVQKIVNVFREVHRVLRDDGTLWLNLGDSYASFRDGKATPDTTRRDDIGTLVPKGSAKNRMASTFKGSGVKHKDLIGIPWRVAFALQADGWYLRQDIIWHKPNPMPESVIDRCTKAHEYIFLFSKSSKYYFDSEAIKEPAITAGSKIVLGENSFAKRQAKGANVKATGNGLKDIYEVKKTRNKRSVWTVATKPFKGAHFATYPEKLIESCILAGCPKDGYVFDPFMGAGTTAVVAEKFGRRWIGSELNEEYGRIAEKRILELRSK